MIDWPDNLALPIKYGASTEYGKNNKISTDMDYGNKVSRRRFTSVPEMQAITISYNDAQYQQFIAFYKGILKDGVISFNAKVIVGQTVELRRCRIDDDSLVWEHDDYNHHTASFNLEIRNLPGLYGDAMYLIGLYGEDFVINVLMDPLDYIVNVQYPAINE
jgi:hypothetical protein